MLDMRALYNTLGGRNGTFTYSDIALHIDLDAERKEHKTKIKPEMFCLEDLGWEGTTLDILMGNMAEDIKQKMMSKLVDMELKNDIDRYSINVTAEDGDCVLMVHVYFKDRIRFENDSEVLNRIQQKLQKMQSRELT